MSLQFSAPICLGESIMAEELWFSYIFFKEQEKSDKSCKEMEIHWEEHQRLRVQFEFKFCH